jgi:hypothetical protein
VALNLICQPFFAPSTSSPLMHVTPHVTRIIRMRFTESGSTPAPANPGGGHVVSLVISSALRFARSSDDAFNHYSMMATIEDSWNLGCLANTCDRRNVRPMKAWSDPWSSGSFFVAQAQTAGRLSLSSGRFSFQLWELFFNAWQTPG